MYFHPEQDRSLSRPEAMWRAVWRLKAGERAGERRPKQQILSTVGIATAPQPWRSPRFSPYDRIVSCFFGCTEADHGAQAPRRCWTAVQHDFDTCSTRFRRCSEGFCLFFVFFSMAFGWASASKRPRPAVRPVRVEKRPVQGHPVTAGRPARHETSSKTMEKPVKSGPKRLESEENDVKSSEIK